VTIINYTDFLDDDLDLSSGEDCDRIEYKSTKTYHLSIENMLRIIEALKLFKGKYDKRVNISKLCDKLKISVKDREKYLNLILKFQELFQDIFDSHSLDLKKERNVLYFTTKKKNPPKKDTKNSSKKNTPPDKIALSDDDFSLLNDIIYLFTNVRRGKGFSFAEMNSDLMKGLKRLRREHPYLFFSNGHGLVYPTEFTIELAHKIRSYLKCNRSFETLKVKNCMIINKM
jgi:hypothetical protein